MSDYKYPRISETVNRKELAIWGVEHSYEFFYRHRALFRDFVRNNDVLVLEHPPGANFWEVEGFFDSLGELAREQGKRVYEVDPLEWENLFLDVGTGFVGGILAYKSIRKLTSPAKTTRRNFLKALPLLALGVPLIMGSWPIRFFQDRFTDKISVNYGIDDTVGYGSDDYRNIVIAEGLDRICHEIDDIKNIGVAHGAAHSDAVHKYLISPNKRKKRLVYFPHDFLGNTKIREYTPTTKGWELTRTF
jgi:hypothetical protein